MNHKKKRLRECIGKGVRGGKRGRKECVEIGRARERGACECGEEREKLYES